jgi:tRNA 2-thiouridine synthesizing protein A
MMVRHKFKGMAMRLLNLFHMNTGTLAADQRHVCTRVEEKVELPGFGVVEVGCRLACEGEGCPRPQLKTLKALDENEKGVVIEIISDNPSVVETIPSMMDMFDGQHLATVRGTDNWRIYVRREE